MRRPFAANHVPVARCCHCWRRLECYVIAQGGAAGSALIIRPKPVTQVEEAAGSMGDIVFFNTLGGHKEPFVPLQPGQVRIYTCGPTVYNFAHIGNFRTFVFQDILRRFLRSRGFHLVQVMNLTDVDDRIIAKAAEAEVDIRDYTDKFIEAFLADQRILGIEKPEHVVRATDHIEDMVQLIERLTAKGFTYVSDGSIYFRISQVSRIMASSPIWISPESRPGRAWTWIGTRRRMRGTSRCGRRPSRESFSGTPESGRAGQDGTSSARRWP